MAIIDNLLGYWNLDETSGDAADASGNGYTLANTNVTFAGGGANFDANSDKLQNTNTVFDFQPTNPFSVSFWVDLVSVGSNQMLVTNQFEGGDFQGWGIFQSSSGTIGFDMVQDLSPVRYLGVRTPASTLGTSLKHVLVTKASGNDVSTVKIYVDGVSQTLTSLFNNLSGTITYSSDLRFGNRGDSYNMNGLLRNAGIWNIELTSGDATFLYNGGTPLAFADLTAGTLYRAPLMFAGL
jgi:hypothetical protein